MISKAPNEAIGPVGFRRRECTTCAAHFIKRLGGITAISQRGFKRALPLREQRQLASPTLFLKNRVINLYRFTWMGHDQCVATTFREHNDLKDSAKAYTQQIKNIGKLCRSTQGNSADPLRETQQIHSGKLCRSTQGNFADPLRETLQGATPAHSSEG